MGRNRYNPFDPGQAPFAVFPDAVAPPIPDKTEEKRVNLEVELRYRAEARRVRYFGFDGVVCLFDYVRNPFVFGGPDILSVISFQVPQGRTLEVNGISVQFSEPIYHATEVIGWRPTVDDGQIPYIGNLSGKVSGYFTSPLGDFHNPATIDPIYVQSSSVFAVKLFRSEPDFDSAFIATAWILGKLHKPIGGK